MSFQGTNKTSEPYFAHLETSKSKAPNITKIPDLDNRKMATVPDAYRKFGVDEGMRLTRRGVVTECEKARCKHSAKRLCKLSKPHQELLE